MPVDSAAADALGAPNYDEFQSDREVWELLQAKPTSVLRVTMPHCHVPSVDAIGKDDSDDALAHAAEMMKELIADRRTKEVRDLLWVYELTSPARPFVRQIGLGGMARTGEIRTPENPNGVIIRNEGIREPKARGRARLTEATHADMGTVNLAVDDASGELNAALLLQADSVLPDVVTSDEEGNRHRMWLLQDAGTREKFRQLIAREPRAYVADGNHRSAAAAMLGYEHYLAVFFPAATMTIAPYNRLLENEVPPLGDVPGALSKKFTVERAGTSGPFQPQRTHEIGFYDGQVWWRLRPRPGTYDPNDAAQDIDADIVQRNLFADVFGIYDARDDRLTFVGANRDAAWLENEVNAGRFRYAVTLPPVTMQQFIDVCLQDRLMPPKSTWFVPKIRSGLVMALLD
ncbi:MAG TPA: DUF1015 family protein [Gemmatimonadaceae bacterium]|nr:DUF1015 family protein [Gemmatimonadaceae bacterium]